MNALKLLVLVSLFSSGMVGSAMAQVYTYTPNNGSSDTWSTGADWSSTPVSGSTTELTFVGTNATVLANGLTNTNTNDISSPPFLLNILDLQGTGPTTGAGSITVAGSQLSFVSNGATTPVINLNALKGAAGLTYTVQNNIALTNNTTFMGNGTANFVFSGLISGSGTLTKSGSSTLTLSGLNTFTGATTINGGILSINSITNVGTGASSLGDPTTNLNGTITLAGGTLQYTGSSLGSSSRIIALTATGSSLDASGSATFALSGGVTTSANNTETLTLTGTGVGTESGALGTSGSNKLSSLTKSGSGTWILSGNVFDNGGMTVNASGGTLEAANTSALYAGATGSWITTKIIVKSNSTLAFGVGGSGFTSGQIDTLNTNLIAGGSATGGFEANSFIGLDTTGGNFSYATPIGNNGAGGTIGLTKLGINALTLSSPNTYSGATTVSAGTLYVNGGTAGSGTSSGTGSGAVSVTSGGTLAGSGNIVSSGVTIGAGAKLASGPVQASAPTVTGPGLTFTNTSVTASGTGTGALSANLTFALGSGTDHLGVGTPGPGNFTNPITDTTYMTLSGTSKLNFTGTESVSLVDLTAPTSSTGATLSLRLATPYLLVAAGSNSDYTGLITVSGSGVSAVYSLDGTGYVVGVLVSGSGYTGGLTAPVLNTQYTPIAINQFAADGITPLAGNDIYASPALYLNAGNLEVVPEPGTWALMLGGLVVLVFIQRRKSTRS